MGDRLDQRNVGSQCILKDILSIAGRTNPKYFKSCALILNLSLQLFEYLLSLFYRVTIRQLVVLDQDIPVFIDQNRLG